MQPPPTPWRMRLPRWRSAAGAAAGRQRGGARHRGPSEIARRLVEQVTGTVRWRECVAYMAGEG